MPRYLIQAKYSVEGTKGILKDGGSKRVAVVSKMIESLGGKVESFYFAFGEDDALVIVDLPDNVSAAAISLAIGSAGGAASLTTKVLLTPEEMDEAAKTKVDYRPPGA